jgi:hypothetical protein
MRAAACVILLFMRSVPILLLAGICFLAPAARAEDRKSPRPEGDYLKVEVRGRLTVPDKLEKFERSTGASKATSESYAGAFITAGDTEVSLYLDKDLLKAARKLNGKKAVLTGTLLFIYPPEGTERISTVRPLHPHTIIQVTAVKPAEAR